MERRSRLAGLAAVGLVVVVAGAALAVRGPRTDSDTSPAAASQAADPDANDAADSVAHVAERLEAAGIDVEPAVLDDLAERYGVGGAVRVVAWADETGKSVEEIAAMRDGDGTEGSTMGWGQIAKVLGVNPGIGEIMGNGGGHGRDTAPGQLKKDDATDE